MISEIVAKSDFSWKFIVKNESFKVEWVMDVLYSTEEYFYRLFNNPFYTISTFNNAIVQSILNQSNKIIWKKSHFLIDLWQTANDKQCYYCNLVILINYCSYKPSGMAIKIKFSM